MQVSRTQRSSWRSSEPYARYSNGYEGIEDPRFVRIDDEEIRLALSLYDRDPNVQMVANVLLNSLLSAMIIFRHKGDTNRFANDTEEDRWRSQVYGDLCREMVRQKKALGWTAVTAVPDPRHVGKPVVLNVERCEVYVNVDVFGIPHFRFFERIQFPEVGGGAYANKRMKPSIGEFFLGGPMQLRGIDVSSERREILNVKVFYEQAPTNDGHLRSPVLLLAPDLRFEEHLAACCTASDAMRSNPPLVTQKASKQPDSKNLTMINRFAPGGMHSVYDGDGEREGGIREAQVRQFEAQNNYLRHLDGLVNERVNDASGAIPASLSTVSRKHLTGMVGVYEYQVETDRTVAKQVLPESPHDMYLNFRQARMERIMSLFGVPAPMLTEKNSIGSKVSMNENAYVVYMEAQKHMKQTLISDLYEIYRSIHDPTNALDYMEHTMVKKKAKPSPKGLNESLEVIITMPGLPPEETVKELYTMGILKYDAYKRFLHDKHAIPIEDFNEEPEISVEDLNGCGGDQLQGSSSGSSSSSSGSSSSTNRAKHKAK